jgi:DNA recombination protein RmuC
MIAVVIVVVGAVVLALVAGALLGLRLRPPVPLAPSGPTGAELDAAFQQAVALLRQQAAAERDLAVKRALEQAAVMTREGLGAQLAAGRRELEVEREHVDVRLEQVRAGVADDINRLSDLVQQLGRSSSRGFGEVASALAAHAESTSSLAATTQSLREALASPKARGQWGERMAEDVLRLAGFVEHVNYEKQTAVEGARGLPDFTFALPKGHVLYMDVKFPLASYLRFLEAGTEAERSAFRDSFLKDVRLRVRELAGREYARQGAERATVDYVLLFLPNETISSFVHESDPTLVDDALRQKVVLCSPLTLFALLGVIRQAFDNFMIEQTSDEILRVLAGFEHQWEKFSGSLEVMGRRLDSAQRAFEELNGPRRRQLERPLQRLTSLRNERGIAIDAPADEADEADVLELGGRRGEIGA